MVGTALTNMHPHKAPGEYGIPTSFLQAMGEPLETALADLTQACWDWEYVPKIFRHARTILIKKDRKPSYADPKAWRPIALLNTLGKVVESVTARALQEIAEKYELLPEMQMGARRNRLTQTALDLLVSQIHTIWEAGGVASLLSIDMSGAFDHVVKRKLISILRRKGIPRPLIGWIDSFMTDRTTTLSFDDKTSQPLEVPAGIPQGFPISPILFLFYNADLIDKCNEGHTRAQAIGFVDDVNILASSHSTKENCRILKEMHEKCIGWARGHGARFVPDKYKLLHLSRKRKHQGWRSLKINDALDCDCGGPAGFLKKFNILALLFSLTADDPLTVWTEDVFLAVGVVVDLFTVVPTICLIDRGSVGGGRSV
jgi:Reverse transcriptase (RNA-dependent DNA polymerase)